MPHTKRVFDALEKNIDWFREKLGRPTSMLYVGWRHDAHPWWHDVFAKKLGIVKLGVLEIFPKNVGDLEQQVWAGRYNVVSHCGDVRKIDQVIPQHQYDIIFWDHGPEHVSWEDLKTVTPLLYSWAGRMLLYCAPWGEWPQGEEDGNEHEVHRNYITKDQFLSLGLSTVTFGQEGQAGEGELVGFKMLNQYSFDEGMGW